MSYLTDIGVSIRLASGRREKVTVPPDISTQEFVDQLVEGLELASENHARGARWRLIDPDTGKALRPEKTLNDNGVHAGQELLLEEEPLVIEEPKVETVVCLRCATENSAANRFCRRCRESLEKVMPPSDLSVHVHREDGPDTLLQVSPEFRTAELMSLVLGSLVTDPTREGWTLYNKDTGRDLVAWQSMTENMVQSGHHLYLRNTAPPGPHKKDPQPLQKDPLPKSKVQEKENTKPVLVNAKRKTIGASVAVALAVAVVAGVVALVRGSGGTLTLIPGSAELAANSRQQFTASFKGKPAEVQWTISPQLGTITPDGLYVAPRAIGSAEKVEVTAKLASDPAKFAVSQIALQPGHEVVELEPATATLDGGGTAQFSAQVSGASGTESGVRWTLQPEVGSIAANGLYTAPPIVMQETVVEVKASSMVNPNRTASSHVTIEPVTVTLRPKNATVLAQGNLHVTATVAGAANHGVQWTLTGPGTLSKAGSYLAPGNLIAPVTARITATSSADATKSATASIIVQPVVGISLTPSSGTLIAGQRARFTAAVTGTANTAARWTLSGPGTLSTTGEYQAPATVAKENVARIKATSEADPSKSAETSLTLLPVVVTLVPAEVQLRSAQTNWFTATVNVGGKESLKWSLLGPGTLTQQGIYSAPGLVTADQTVTVKVTSTLDPSRSATATVRLKRYEGPLAGTLTWAGTPGPDGNVTIDGTLATPGTMRGDPFPGMPITVQLDSKDYSVALPPAPSNGWKRLVLTTKKRKGAAVRISWRIVNEGSR